MTTDIFIAGGALTDEQAEIYIERQADQEVLIYLRTMKYIQIIEPRQQGKTSFVNHLIYLARSNDMVIAYVDTSTIDHSTEANCYHSLYHRILDQWRELIPPAQRPAIPANSTGWRKFLYDLAVYAYARQLRILIVLDEIGASRVPNATDFFSVLREIFNSRQTQVPFKNLTFLLTGAFRPRDLIDDDSISPFNIAQPLRLPDFTASQVHELVAKGGWPEEQARSVSERIHYWTDGHPYLTQLLCGYLGSEATPADVDQGVERLQREDPNNLPPLLKALDKDTKLREYVDSIRIGEKIKFYPQANQRQAKLDLLGLLKADGYGYCSVRNRIYDSFLSAAWGEPKRVTQQSIGAFRRRPRQPGNRPGIQEDFIYDVFISYSSKDLPWVRDMLIPRLDGISTCVDRLNFLPGISILDNIEDAAKSSRRTLLVITPAWLKSEWTAFEALLVQMRDLTGRRQRVIPLLVKRCKLPDRLGILTPLYFTHPNEFELQMQRLIDTLRSVLPSRP
ncbi:MAG TPA: AAA-like domain-containing protein [Thermoanaerobaculia bacterium]|jgi:hypothetical protein